MLPYSLMEACSGCTITNCWNLLEQCNMVDSLWPVVQGPQ